MDLMRLYLTRRNLDAIAGIDLAGIKPFYEATIKLGDGKDFDDKTRAIDLPVKKEGAYLVMVRGDDRYTSGILLVTPLELQVLEEPESGRVRVTVRDARTKAFVPKVQVKVIGSSNPAFFSGETDLRGVFVAEGVLGQVTAVARKGTNEYAFHRGTTFVGQIPAPAKPGEAETGKPAAQAPGQPMDLQQNLRGQNIDNQKRSLQRLEQRYQHPGQGREGQVGLLRIEVFFRAHPERKGGVRRWRTCPRSKSPAAADRGSGPPPSPCEKTEQGRESKCPARALRWPPEPGLVGIELIGPAAGPSRRSALRSRPGEDAIELEGASHVELRRAVRAARDGRGPGRDSFGPARGRGPTGWSSRRGNTRGRSRSGRRRR